MVAEYHSVAMRVVAVTTRSRVFSRSPISSPVPVPRSRAQAYPLRMSLRPRISPSLRWHPRAGLGLLLSLALGACSVPAPYQPPATPLPVPPEPSVQTQPATPPGAVGEPEPLPAPVLHEPTLGAASRALVGQAQAQLAGGNYAVAASSIERALRIEPDNPLLWIELGKLRQAEGNHVQAENMGRKAVSMATTAPRVQADAWRLIAESYRARGMNTEAQDALLRADDLISR